MFHETKRFLKSHPQLTVLPADKGNSTILMETLSYKTKMLEILEDPSNYMSQGRNPTLSIHKTANAYVNGLEIKINMDSKTAKSFGTRIPFHHGFLVIIKSLKLTILFDRSLIEII